MVRRHLLDLDTRSSWQGPRHADLSRRSWHLFLQKWLFSSQPRLKCVRTAQVVEFLKSLVLSILMSSHPKRMYHWGIWNRIPGLHNSDPTKTITSHISYNYQLTPNMTSEAPVNVAECPPLGDGGTPSIYGKAQSHCLSTIKWNEK